MTSRIIVSFVGTVVDMLILYIFMAFSTVHWNMLNWPDTFLAIYASGLWISMKFNWGLTEE